MKDLNTILGQCRHDIQAKVCRYKVFGSWLSENITNLLKNYKAIKTKIAATFNNIFGIIFDAVA